MKKFLQSVTAFLIAFAMVAAPVAEAQTRGRVGYAERNGATTSNKTPSSRPNNGGNNQGNNHRPGNNGQQRPGGNNQGNNRPGNNGQQRPGGGQNHRPGNQPGNNQRPPQTGNHWGNYRPGQPGRPGRPGRPGQAGHPGQHRPGGDYRPGYHRPTPPPPPRRHHYGYRHPVPFFGHYHRPVPPPAWHYRTGGPVFGTILGVALGTAISVSINSLINSGYTVSSYGDNVVYLQNVPQMNYTWPDAALYYNNGVLYGSQFTYPTAYYDMSRYNNLYGIFTSRYGMPVQTTNQGGVMSASWFGAGNRYVTLSFGLNGGAYYTTLSFGN